MNKPIVWLIIFVAAIGSAGAATYYVDSADGRDEPAWNGGPSQPWATLTYALSRASGENTFMCRGVFEEAVRVDIDDRISTFIANPTAGIKGSIITVYEVVSLELDDFDISGYAGGGCKGYVIANRCYFNYPSNAAFQIDGFHGRGAAYDCVFEDCKSVMSISGFEFGTARFEGCEVKSCASGISYSGEATVSATSCRFDNVAGTAFSASMWSDFATVSNCEIVNCGTGAVIRGSNYGSYGVVKDSLFKYNDTPLRARYEYETWGGIEIRDNLVTENRGSGADVGGVRIKLRGNAITSNAGHGVYITEGDPDLGTPGDAGGNTFAGNGSGYDVYNASSEDIPAYGNTWDPQAEQEMAGKTWRDVNVTRIYDHWDNPSSGYVMWSDFSAVRPASLGRIKAAFGEGPGLELAPSPAKTSGP